MPRARTHRALIPCLGCGRPSPTSRCPTCAPTYGSAWRTLRAQAKAAHPYCSRCGSPGPLEVDHLDPSGFGQSVQVLCVPCHHDKTAGQGGWAGDANRTSLRDTPHLRRIVNDSGLEKNGRARTGA